MISLSEIRLQQKTAILTLIYKTGNKYAGGERHENKDHPGGYSEEGGILGTGEKSVPEY